MQETQASLLDEGYRDLEAKRNRQAVDKFRQAVSQDPKNGRAYQGLAQGLSRLGRYEEAEQASRTALELDPNLAIPHQVLAFIFAKQGQYAESRSEVEAAIQLDPNAASALVTLGFLYVKEGRSEEAKESFKQAVHTDAGNSAAHYNLAICYLREKRFAESLHEAWTAWRLSPSRQTGSMVTRAFFTRYRWAVGLFAALAAVNLTTGRSLFALPLAAIMIAFHLFAGIMQFRSGDRAKAVWSVLSVLFWVGLYVFTQVL